MERTFRAGASDLLRVTQKDDFFVNEMRKRIIAIAEKHYSNRTMQRWQLEFWLLADLCYYIANLSNDANHRTLGEEFCDVVPVVRNGPASRRRRLLFALLHILPQYLLRRMPGRRSHPKLATAAREIADGINRIHLAYCYLGGSFLLLSRRLTATSHIMNHPVVPTPSYWYIGVCLLITQAVLCYRSICLTKDEPEEVEVEDTDAEADLCLYCQVCMSNCRVPTATPCGHLFCWDCIAGWSNQNMNCPLCRTACLPQELLPVYHYAPKAAKVC